MALMLVDAFAINADNSKVAVKNKYLIFILLLFFAKVHKKVDLSVNINEKIKFLCKNNFAD